MTTSSFTPSAGEQIAHQIGQHLDRLNWDFDRLADETGLTWGSLVRSRGDASDMNLNTLNTIAAALGVPVTDLTGEPEAPGGAGAPWGSLTPASFDNLDNDTVSNIAYWSRRTLRNRAEKLSVTHPAWCSHDDQCRVDYDADSTHPEDWLSFHESRAGDRWLPVGGRGGPDLVVLVEGSRHPNRSEDWPDTVVAHGTFPGFMGAINLGVEDTRRLAQALIKACDLAETDAAGGQE